MHRLLRTASVLTVVALTATMAPTALAHDYDTVHRGFMSPNTTLTRGTPESVGLVSAPIEDARAELRSHLVAKPGVTYPLYPGVVAVAGHDGVIVAEEASGWAYLYQDATRLAPETERVPMRHDTIFDLASVSKLFTSLAAVQLIDEGALDLSAPVATYLPEFGVNGKGGITVQMLLTHTSGLAPWLPLWSAYPDKPARIQAVMDATPTTTPGTAYAYSDLNLITLGVIVEKLRGASLDQVVKRRITAPLGMAETGYNPLSWGVPKTRIAATEWQGNTTGRGLVWGSVHDENAWSLDGVAGHAGVFSTARDLAVLSQALLNGGSYRGQRILSRKGVDLLITNFNEQFPGDDHGLGFELNQRWYAAGLAGPREAGHTGYTGTSLVIDFDSRSFAITLTNRVHPVRTAGSVNPARRAWAQGLALAMPIRPQKGPDAWFTGVKDATTSTLTLTVGARAKATLRFELFVDTEDSDPLFLEVSRDNGATWQPLPFTVRDRGKPATLDDGRIAVSGLRRYMQASAALKAGDQLVRWRSVTNDSYLGRGIYVDAIRVTGPGAKLDAERNPSLLSAEGWTLSRR